MFETIIKVMTSYIDRYNGISSIINDAYFNIMGRNLDGYLIPIYNDLYIVYDCEVTESTLYEYIHRHGVSGFIVSPAMNSDNYTYKTMYDNFKLIVDYMIPAPKSENLKKVVEYAPLVLTMHMLYGHDSINTNKLEIKESVKGFDIVKKNNITDYQLEEILSYNVCHILDNQNILKILNNKSDKDFIKMNLQMSEDMK